MQQQHLDQRPGAGASPWRARAAAQNASWVAVNRPARGLGQRGRPGQRPGFAQQDLQVVVQLEGSPRGEHPGMGRDPGRAVEAPAGAARERDPHPRPDQPGRHRVADLADHDLGVAIDPRGQRQRGVEPSAGNGASSGASTAKAAHRPAPSMCRSSSARSAATSRALSSASGVVDLRDRDQMGAAEPATVALDPALLVRPRDTGQAVERVEPVVRPEHPSARTRRGCARTAPACTAERSCRSGSCRTGPRRAPRTRPRALPGTPPAPGRRTPGAPPPEYDSRSVNRKHLVISPATHPQIGEVDLGLRPGRMALRHKPGHHPRPTPRLGRELRPASGVLGHIRVTDTCTPCSSTRRSKIRRAGVSLLTRRRQILGQHRVDPSRAPRPVPASPAPARADPAGSPTRSPAAPCAGAPRTCRPTTGSTTRARCQSNRIAANSSILDPIPAPTRTAPHRHCPPRTLNSTHRLARHEQEFARSVGPANGAEPGPNHDATATRRASAVTSGDRFWITTLLRLSRLRHLLVGQRDEQREQTARFGWRQRWWLYCKIPLVCLPGRPGLSAIGPAQCLLPLKTRSRTVETIGSDT